LRLRRRSEHRRRLARPPGERGRASSPPSLGVVSFSRVSRVRVGPRPEVWPETINRSPSSPSARGGSAKTGSLSSPVRPRVASYRKGKASKVRPCGGLYDSFLFLGGRVCVPANGYFTRPPLCCFVLWVPLKKPSWSAPPTGEARAPPFARLLRALSGGTAFHVERPAPASACRCLSLLLFCPLAAVLTGHRAQILPAPPPGRNPGGTAMTAGDPRREGLGTHLALGDTLSHRTLT